MIINKMHITQLIKKEKPPVNPYQPGQQAKEIAKKKKKKKLKAQPSEGRERSTLAQPTSDQERQPTPSERRHSSGTESEAFPPLISSTRDTTPN